MSNSAGKQKLSHQMHICYVELGYPHHHGGGGGAGTYVQLVGRELVRQGYTVSVVASGCSRCLSVENDNGITVYRPSLGGLLHRYLGKSRFMRSAALVLRYLEICWIIARFIDEVHRKHPIDLVEYTEGGDFWHAFKRSFPYIVHLHGSRYTFLRMANKKLVRGEWLYRRLELAFMRRARCVVSPSQALLDLVTEENAHPFDDTLVLPYPLDPRLLTEPVAQPRDTTRQLVMFAARNDPVKGADTLLGAVPLVRQQHPAVDFELFGYKPAAGEALPQGVHCHAFVTKDQLLAHYHRADICVVPSRWDNSPNTVYEAMAAGKPVVASRVGGIPELVEDGVTGFLVEPNEPQQLADAIVRLLQNEQARRAMGERGRERIQKLAGLHENVARRLEIYQQTINNSFVKQTDTTYAHRTR